MSHYQDHDHSTPGFEIPTAPSPELIDHHGNVLGNSEQDQAWADRLRRPGGVFYSMLGWR